MAAGSDNPVAVYGALIANGIIAVTKFVASVATGSSAMFSEGIHSVVDTGNQALILFGIRRSKRPADARHPFGYGKELYFWSFVVAILLFSLGGGLSLYEGFRHLGHPEPVANPGWNYAVLGVALVVEAIAWWIAYRQIRAAEGPDISLLQAMRRSKNPAVFTVLAEDTAAMLGLLVAFLGVFLGQVTGNPVWDAAASLAIGAILCSVAVFLAFESKALLLGEGMRPEVAAAIQRLVESDDAVSWAGRPLTLYFGPKEVLLNLEVGFRHDLEAAELPAAIDRVESAIKREHPTITRVYLEAEGLRRAKSES